MAYSVFMEFKVRLKFWWLLKAPLRSFKDIESILSPSCDRSIFFTASFMEAAPWLVLFTSCLASADVVSVIGFYCSRGDILSWVI